LDELVWATSFQNDTPDGLAPYVSKYTQDYLPTASIRCRLDLPASLPPYPLSAQERHNLFLVIKEALNNIVKHAHATEVRLRMTLAQHTFTITIEDNGQGFTPPTEPLPEAGPATKA
jgi:signal transduction histidine kinase